MCIRDSATKWHTGDMNIADFKKLAPHFKNVEAIILEGWGEPLIYPELIRAVKIVKEYGSRAGFVTSGWGLNRDSIRDLIHAGLDFIGFSLAGATYETHNRIRINSDLQTVLNTLKDFHQIKKEEKLERPRLHIVYLMLRDNLIEIPLLPDIAHDLGIEEVVLINLIQVTNEWQENQRVFTCDVDGRETILKDTEMKARALNLKLRISHLSPGTIAVCEEDPLRNLYISVDGEVAPCVYLYPPVPSPVKRIFCGRECSVEKVTFGNIFKDSFESIWNNPIYVAFRNAFSARNKRFGELRSSLLWGGAEDFRRFKENPLPEPPEPCKTCHKILGL
jgi:MoaA/NifB/PqqE/SkfB family radical SAM enzyme